MQSNSFSPPPSRSISYVCASAWMSKLNQVEVAQQSNFVNFNQECSLQTLRKVFTHSHSKRAFDTKKPSLSVTSSNPICLLRSPAVKNFVALRKKSLPSEFSSRPPCGSRSHSSPPTHACNNGVSNQNRCTTVSSLASLLTRLVEAKLLGQ